MPRLVPPPRIPHPPRLGKRAALAAVAVLLLLVVGCGQDAARPGDPADRADQQGLPAGVAIFAPDDLDADGYGPEADWTPGTADVLAAEEALAERLESEAGGEVEGAQGLTSYVRQYTGVDGDVVQANGSCDRDLDWELTWVVVMDGGACYWQATLREGRIESFGFNGYA